MVLLTCLLTPPSVAQTSSRAVAPVAATPGLLRKLASPMLQVRCKTLSICGSSCDLATIATCTSGTSGNSDKSKPHTQGHKGAGSKIAVTAVVSPDTSLKTYGTISSSMSASGSVCDRPVVPILDFSVIRYP